MTSDEERKLAGLKILRDNLEAYCAQCLKVKDKQGKIVPFLWNRAQHFVHQALEDQRRELGFVRALILKGRQQGISTYIGARFYHRTTMNFGQSAFIVAHEQKATDNLYGMVRRYHDHNPMPVSTGATNAKELIFDRLDGGYKLATAGTKDVGRSNTAQILHACLSPETPIIEAETGRLKRMGDFELGDWVRTHRNNYAQVSAISHQRKLAREVVLRTVSTFPLVATDDHKFWSRSGMKKLGEMAVGDEIGFPVAAIEEREITLDFALAQRPRPQGGGSVERVPEEITLNYDVGRILGLYLAEGTVRTQASGEPASVTFTVHEREVDRTIHWLGIMAGLITSINVHAAKPSKTVAVTAYGRSFASFVARMCGRVDDKVVPDFWRLSGDRFARGLLHGYLCGDGHFSIQGRRIVATSIRAALTVGMRDIAAALGYGWGSISFKPAAVRGGRNERDAYILALCGDGAMRLANECGKPMRPRVRAAGGGNYGAVIDGGYAWLKIHSIGELVERDVMDFEVDHEDHSYCTVQCAASNSEMAFWANAEAHMAGIGNTIADLPGTEIIGETTANGLGNYFHKAWQEAEEGRGNFIPVFVPWFWQPEYRAKVKPDLQLSEEDLLVQKTYGLDMEQMQWRANKISSYGEGFAWLFKQEFPCCPAEAFQSGTMNPLVNPHYVAMATSSTYYDEAGALVIGCDPASDGASTKDRTCIVFRRGRVVFRVEYHEKLNSMQVAGKLAEYHREYQPDAIFVDKGGIGTGIVDRLNELNVPVIGVMFGQAASDHELYANKKAEMWWRMKDWFEEQPCRIVNNPAFISDICAPQPDVSSNGRKILESKEKLEKRQIRSPDGGDALALTFAENVLPRYAMPAGDGGYEAPTKAGY